MRREWEEDGKVGGCGEEEEGARTRKEKERAGE